MSSLDITIGRTWRGKTTARITATVGPSTVDVRVTGWRRTHVIAEAHATFDAITIQGGPMPELTAGQREVYAEFVEKFGEDKADHFARTLLDDATADALAMDLEANRG